MTTSAASPAAQPRPPARAGRATALMVFALTVNLVPMASFAAVLPEIARAWHLSASAAGWIGGVYFAGYAAAVPVLASLTDHIDGRRVFAASSLLGAAASFAFAGCAEGLWTALGLRFLSGVARGSAVYASSYALGAAGSFFVAGAADAALGWRATFTISGIAPLLALAAIALLPPAVEAPPATPFVFDLRPLLRNRALMAYVLAFAGNIWEVSAVRAWFVAYLAWILRLPHHDLALPDPAVISGLASLAGFPASLLVAELALRWGPRAIVATCLASIAVLLGLAASAGGPTLVILPLLVLAQVASMADASALAAGAVAAADPARRGAALALYAFTGYMAAFVGPVAVGFALDAFGGAGNPPGWRAAFVTMALGSTAAAIAMRVARGARNWN